MRNTDKTIREEVALSQCVQGYLKRAMDDTDLPEEYRERLRGAMIYARTQMSHEQARAYNSSHDWS